MSYDDVRDQVARANRVLAEFGLSSGAVAGHGHASMRVPEAPDRFVVKGRGAAVDVLARSRADEMVVCDLEGYTLEGPPGFTPCLEVKMHSSIYKTHPEVQCVVHTHARFITVLSLLGPIVPVCQEGVQLVRRPLPVYPHVAPVLTDEQGMEVASLLGDSKALLLEGHGGTTVGATLDEAVTAMINLEEQARMNWYLRCAAGPDHARIADERVAELSMLARAGELPHLRDVMASRPQRRTGGIYAYYAELADARVE